MAALVEDLEEQTAEGDSRRRDAAEVLNDHGAVAEWNGERVGADRADR